MAAGLTEQSLILCCGKRCFALPLPSVVEVTRMVAPALLLPRAPRYCLGVADYHGQLVPVIDLGVRLGQCAPRSLVEFVDGKLVFVRTPTGLCGFAVDQVLELSDKPVEPLTTTEPSLVGLIHGIVRWHEHDAAPLLRAGGLLPIGAGVRLRQLLAEVLAASASPPSDSPDAGSAEAAGEPGAGA